MRMLVRLQDPSKKGFNPCFHGSTTVRKQTEHLQNPHF
ncbi:Uncharacterized protein dnl_30680 [Desulfonema limicola]|uniref:Uncharacterized protein n=1 Tax=Desulfonema limicola TaxID=45656 RepID=A0A975B8K1_9BACT|nr:Uncharacterized protein dnl_30680 [Desulfonema limicola]